MLTRWYSVDDVAEHLGVPRRWVVRACARRVNPLPHSRLSYRYIRFSEQDVEAIDGMFVARPTAPVAEPNPWGFARRGVHR
jgi:hypothetical protein